MTLEKLSETKLKHTYCLDQYFISHTKIETHTQVFKGKGCQWLLDNRHQTEIMPKFGASTTHFLNYPHICLFFITNKAILYIILKLSVLFAEYHLADPFQPISTTELGYFWKPLCKVRYNSSFIKRLYSLYCIIQRKDTISVGNDQFEKLSTKAFSNLVPLVISDRSYFNTVGIPPK